LKQRTYMARDGEVERKWYVVDASGKTLGRLASRIAEILRGKHKPEFSPHIDVGDFVVVVNAEKVALTGRKGTQKKYYRHSTYPGGLRTFTAKQMLEMHPERVVKIAVKGMLPHNRLGRKIIKKLKVYRGPEHPHRAQRAEPLEL